jgi:hypothetical protein
MARQCRCHYQVNAAFGGPSSAQMGHTAAANAGTRVERMSPELAFSCAIRRGGRRWRKGGAGHGPRDR